MGGLGEFGALFNPGMRHELEERRAKQMLREEEGNARKGRLGIDLDSGVAVIQGRRDREQASAGSDPDEPTDGDGVAADGGDGVAAPRGDGTAAGGHDATAEDDGVPARGAAGSGRHAAVERGGSTEDDGPRDATGTSSASPRHGRRPSATAADRSDADSDGVRSAGSTPNSPSGKARRSAGAPITARPVGKTHRTG